MDDLEERLVTQVARALQALRDRARTDRKQIRGKQRVRLEARRVPIAQQYAARPVVADRMQRAACGNAHLDVRMAGLESAESRDEPAHGERRADADREHACTAHAA